VSKCQNIPERKVYPVKEARQILGGIAESTFYLFVSQGRISTIKFGRRTYVKQEEIDRFLTSCESAA